MEPGRIPVVDECRLRLADAERRADTVAVEVPHRVPSLADHLVGLDVAERFEELSVQRQAALERRDDDVDVVQPDAAHSSILCRSTAVATL